MNGSVNLGGTGNLKSVIFPDNNGQNDDKSGIYYANIDLDIEKSQTEQIYDRKQQIRSRGKFRNSRGPADGRVGSSMNRKLEMLSS
jgi:hypothetical protein